MTIRRDAWFRTFHDLMPIRVREILLVSSHYDAFILEEDGRLTERLFIEYSELNLSTAPRITHAASTERALNLLEQRPFDLVITMVRLDDTDVLQFGRQVKEQHRGMPVVLLAFSEAEIDLLGGVDPESIDHVFVWTGDARILLSIIKVVEDRWNVGPDTEEADIRVILFVEDSVQRYSSLLSILYTELMSQSQSLIAEGVNDLHKRMRLHARPKLLHATSYEQAMEFFERYREYVLALISDIRLPREGELDGQAGFKLVEAMREQVPDLPVLLQSSEPENASRAASIGAHFVGKKTEKFQRMVKKFLAEDLGFGPFVFRLPDRSEVGRARDAYEMEKMLETVPASSLEYHAARNHFSTWLIARSLFTLALQLKPRGLTEFEGLEDLRRYLVRTIRAARKLQHRGAITDFSPRSSDSENDFVRIGGGSLGGKARSIAFINSILTSVQLSESFPEIEVKTPRTVVLATNVYDRFLLENQISAEHDEHQDDDDILQAFLEADLPWEVERDIETACEGMVGPLAVRSSSLLEDSHLQPFAGIYATCMLPNNHPDTAVRAREVSRAVKAVYASAFFKESRAYIQGTAYSFEDEKVGVAIQEVVGRRHGDRFYPDISGVALSYNFYPVGYQKPEQGIVMLALGLGHQVVSGGQAVQFCPSSPGVLPQYPTPREFLEYSQRKFWAIDMSRPTMNLFAGPESSLEEFPLSAAEEDGPLAAVASTYDVQNDRIRDSFLQPGPRVVTFRNILTWNAIPLAPVLEEVLQIFREALGCAVEIEFSVNLGGWGSPGASNGSREFPCLYLLQIRPQGMFQLHDFPSLEGYAEEDILIQTPVAKGHGLHRHIRDVVYVKNLDLDGSRTPGVARQVGQFNEELVAEGREYLLLGPGRWGSSDNSLGIPVEWSEISGARLIVETTFLGRVVEPSQGSHFFHNIMSRQIGYLTIPPYADGTIKEEGFLDQAWLDSQPVAGETANVRHLRLAEPLQALLDGRNGRALVLKACLAEVE